MKLHLNAKTTPHMRALLVDRITVQRWRPELAARAAGVSRRTAYKWLRRHREGGRTALDDRSSRPHRQPRRTSADRIAAIVAARYERQAAWTIAVRLQIPRSTVAVVLARTGLNRLACVTPPEPIVRYEHTHPGALDTFSSARSAFIRFSFAFSASSSRSLFTSDTDASPYFPRHLKNGLADAGLA